MDAVRVRDVSPRLALQACNVPTSCKVELVERLIVAGIRAVEVSSFVNPKLVPGLADAEQVFARLPRRADVSLECCVGNRRGLARAIDAGADAAWFLLAADEAFSLANSGKGVDESLTELEAMRALSDASGIRLGTYIIATWGGPAGPARQPSDLERVFERLAQIGVREWILADSFGYAGPAQMRDMMDAAARFIDRKHTIVQIHDSRGLGLANAVELLKQRVGQIDTTLGGSGAHPALPPEQQVGGLCTEDLVQFLELSGFCTGIDLPSLIDTANWLEQTLGVPGRGFVRRVGAVPTSTPPAGARTQASSFDWQR